MTNPLPQKINRTTKLRMLNKAFTLIELLVVISIIGMLSSVIMVSLRGARDKGVVAAGIKFATYNYRGFGDKLIGSWNFNEGGTVAPLDNSGNGLNFAQTITRSTDVPTKTGFSADFSTNQSTLNMVVTARRLPYTGFAYGIWVKPNNFSSAVTVLEFAHSGWGYSGPLKISVDTAGKASCSPTEWTLSTPVILASANFPKSNASLMNGQWNQITCNYNGNGKLSLYLNGKLEAEANPLPIPNNSNYMLYDDINIGKGHTLGTAYVVGLVDDVVVYDQSLTASDIQSIYAKGAAEHGIALK